MISPPKGRMNWAAVTWAFAMFSAVTVGNITVIQSPQSLTKTPGQTADLLCRYEGPTGIGSYTWHRGTKQGNEVSNNTAEYRGRVFGASEEDFRQRRDASIRIIQLKPEDTGFYFCNVQLVGFAAAEGHGTTVTVERRQQSGGESSHGESAPMIQPFVYAAVAVPLVIIIIIIIIVVISRHRKRVALQQPTSPDPLYSEIHETERNYDSSECRRTNRREGDDKLQYATLNVQDSNQTERPVKREAVLYASVK